MGERYRLKLRDADLSTMDFKERLDLARETKDIKILKQLAKDEESWVRAEVARNINCPVDILRKLSNDESDYARERAIENPNCPVDVLEKLAKDDDYNIRWIVSNNKNTPVDVLIQLANDKNKWVRRAVCWNNNLPKDILRQLAEDESNEVRKEACRKLGIKYTPSTPKNNLSKSSKFEFSEAYLEDEDGEEIEVKFPTKITTIGNPKIDISTLKRLTGYGVVGPDGRFSDIIFKEAVNPEDPKTTHYIGYYGGDDGVWENDSIMIKHLLSGDTQKAYRRFHKLSVDEDMILWFKCTKDDPTGEIKAEVVSEEETN